MIPNQKKQLLPEYLAAKSAQSCTQENSSGNPHLSISAASSKQTTLNSYQYKRTPIQNKVPRKYIKNILIRMIL